VDVMKDLIDRDELRKVIPVECTFEEVKRKLKESIGRGVVVFGKGVKESVDCDEKTREVLMTLSSHNINYHYTDMFKDEMVGEIVSEINNVSFPQIYCDGLYIDSNKLKSLNDASSLYTILPITYHASFHLYSDYFTEKTIQLILLNESFEIVEILYGLSESNPDYAYITYKKSMAPALITFVKGELKVNGDNYITFKDNKVYNYV